MQNSLFSLHYLQISVFILISDQFNEKIRRQTLADLGKRQKAGCRPPRAFDEKQRVNGGEDFH